MKFNPNPELERYKGILLEIADRRPGLPIHEALVMAADIEETLERDMPAHPNDHTPVKVAAKWCRMQPAVVDFVLEDKIINAIKEARARSLSPGGERMGLRAAKEAVEYMRAHLLP